MEAEAWESRLLGGEGVLRGTLAAEHSAVSVSALCPLS